MGPHTGMKTSTVNAHMYFNNTLTYNNYKQAMFLIPGGEGFLEDGSVKSKLQN